MAYNKNIKVITLDGTGTETDLVFDVTDQYSSYELIGAVTTIGNYAIVPTGTPQLGTTFVFDYQATVDITTNGNTFAIFGTQITQELLIAKLIITCSYNGSGWKVRITGSLDQAIIDTVNIIPGAIDSTVIENLAITTAKIDNLAVTTAKIDTLAVTDAKINDVDGSKIVSASIANSKLASMADQTIKGNLSGGASTPSDISVSSLMSANAWGLTGNAGTTPGTNFVGTTDAVDLVFKVNNVSAGRISYDTTIANVALGYQALLNNTTGNYSTAFGESALKAQSTGIYNTAIGYRSGQSFDASTGNTSLGALALYSSSVSSLNTAVGFQALYALTTGYNNIGVGAAAGDTITTGNNNTIIGNSADVDSTSSLHRVALGQNSLADTDYQFALPDNVTAWKIRGNSFTLPSADGNPKAALVTDGSKVLSFGSIIDSGTYTPSLTNGTNVAASTAYPNQWIRVGNVVTVSGKVAIDATAATVTELGMSLPIASNFGNDYECAGVGVDAVAGEEPIVIKADAANNRASFNQVKADTSNHDHYFTFTYSVI